MWRRVCAQSGAPKGGCSYCGATRCTTGTISPLLGTCLICPMCSLPSGTRCSFLPCSMCCLFTFQDTPLLLLSMPNACTPYFYEILTQHYMTHAAEYRGLLRNLVGFILFLCQGDRVGAVCTQDVLVCVGEGITDGDNKLRQVEARCQVRRAFPAPREGSLPLAADLDPAQLSYKPSCVEDFNSLIPDGAPKLATPQQHPNVSSHLPTFHFPAISFWCIFQ